MGNNAFFDFSGPLSMGTWDEAMLLSPNSWPSDPSLSGTATQPIYELPLGHQSSGPHMEATSMHRPRRSIQSVPERGPYPPDPTSTSPFSAENVPNANVDEDLLVNTFLQMLMPPILTPVEIGKNFYV